ncbi:Ig-like domain-containing protein [Microbacterium sp.]|uniref:Ig-like domain-containing protein n=1 Tax=Microbacterium sp. TaxID=51671 RepID=UPI003562C253
MRTHATTAAREKAVATVRKRERWRGILALIVGSIVGVSGLWGVAMPAAAAPTVTYPGAMSGISIETTSGSGPVTQWQQVRISGEWAVPDGAVAGETFGMTMPAEFHRQAAGTFAITDPTTGAVLADCAVSDGDGPDVVCTLTDAVTGKAQVGGTFWMQATASRTTASSTVEFDLGDTVEIVDLPGGGGIVPEDPREDAEPSKHAGVSTGGHLRWVVEIPSGYAAAGGFTISDVLDAGLADHHYTEELTLSRQAVEDGILVGGWTEVSSANYEVVFAADGQSFDLVASGLPAGGFAYKLVYYTQSDLPVVEGEVFGNHVTVNTTETSATHTVTESGGGDGGGVDDTRFSITKVLTGPQAAAAQDATYTVRYSIKGSTTPAKTITVPVGESAVSDPAPGGSTFVIEEVDLPVIEGVSWGAWTIAGEGVVDAGDGTFEVSPATAAGVALTLTNEANAVPVAPPSPTPTPVVPVDESPAVSSSASPGALAVTGGGEATGFLVLGLVLLLGGGVATSVAARRRAAAARR